MSEPTDGKILVMLSGGLDSTGMFYKLLTETQRDLHVHHVSLRNAENRWQCELKAVKDITNYCKDIRPFQFSVNTFTFPFSRFICWDNDVVRFIAAQIAQDDPLISEVALGKCIDDNNEEFVGRAEQSAKIWDACFHTYKGRIPTITRPVEVLDKLQIYNALPEGLRKLTWSCRMPVANEDMTANVPCQRCKTCEQMIKHGLL